MSNLDIALPEAATHGEPAVAPSTSATPPFAFDPRVSWLAGALDEVDYGVLVLSGRDRIRFANRTALAELASGAALRVVDGRLHATLSADSAALDRALADAERRSLRHMLIIGHGERRLGLSVVPLAGSPPTLAAGTAVMLGKRQICHPLSIAGYSRSHGLTNAEGRVLAELCNGSEPQDVARRFAVSISTVRSQIGSIRSKTGAASIVALMRQLAVLPPILVALGRMGQSVLNP
jgi:DNA-binding CsgD family transcriptional regulator